MITWNKYFMELAKLTAERSKDPKTKVGAVIIDPKNNHIISIGYNGLPYGMNDSKNSEKEEDFDWNLSEEENWEHSKHYYIVHAEANAILNSSLADLTGMTIYVTMFPCNECAKLIAQKRLGKVVFKDRKYMEKDSGKAAMRILKAAGVEVIQYTE